jgi:hypothetical protein
MRYALAPFLLMLTSAAITPLSDEQSARLAAAVEGSEFRDEGFAALVENVQSWTGSAGDEPIRMNPDAKAILENPSAYRGDLCRITGTIQQHGPLLTSTDSIQECFVRGPDGSPLLVYMVGQLDEKTFRDGTVIEIDARFYKTMIMRARDGLERAYPAFVGAFPRAAVRGYASQTDQFSRLWMIAGPLAAMLIAFLWLLMRVRNRSAARRRSIHLAPSARDEVDEGAALPDDPAEALAELKRRANTGL